MSTQEHNMDYTNTITLTIGISNSGKTTWANEKLLDSMVESNSNPTVVNINRDDIRATNFTKSGNIKDYVFSKQREIAVSTIAMDAAICCANRRGLFHKKQDIIISDTNLNPKSRDTWKEFAERNQYNYVEKVFDVEPHICKQRNIKRDYSVPPHVIDNQYRQLRKYLGIATYTPDPTLKQMVIFDMDGTLSDMSGIRKPYEWVKCIDDKPRPQIIELLELYADRYMITIMSGRDSICEPETMEWLRMHNIAFNFLFMRKHNDNRSDPIVKEELFDKHIRGKYNVKVVVDDRQRMVDHWRNMGLECLQVNNGDF